MKSSALLALLVALFSLASLATAQTPSLDGLWDATVKIQNPKDGSVLVVPFRFELSGDPANIKGSFFNGDERVTSTGGRFSDGVLLLNFDHYASRLEAKLDNGVLAGKYGNPARALYDFSAQPHVTAAAGSGKAPNIDGQWEIEVESPKGEHAWRLIVKQSGTDVSAAILRVDGDTGTLTGAYADGKFLLSHFSGARPGILEIVPQPDGSLQLTQKSSNGPARTLTAWRPADARAKGLPAPTDPSQHTRVKGPSQPFQFSFPDEPQGHEAAQRREGIVHRVHRPIGGRGGRGSPTGRIHDSEARFLAFHVSAGLGRRSRLVGTGRRERGISRLLAAPRRPRAPRRRGLSSSQATPIPGAYRPRACRMCSRARRRSAGSPQLEEIRERSRVLVGVEEFTLKNPPPFVPSILMATWDATGPTAICWSFIVAFSVTGLPLSSFTGWFPESIFGLSYSVASTVDTVGYAEKVCGMPWLTRTTARTSESGSRM